MGLRSDLDVSGEDKNLLHLTGTVACLVYRLSYRGSPNCYYRTLHRVKQ
jgi:hypothetical protein